MRKPPPQFDAAPALRAMGMGRAPEMLDRVGRVRLIGKAADILIEEGSAAGLFVGGRLKSWLENGGNLERDFLHVVANGSHYTPARVWKTLQEKTLPLKGATDAECEDTLRPSLPESE